jgi:hypothetical protein
MSRMVRHEIAHNKRNTCGTVRDCLTLAGEERLLAGAGNVCEAAVGRLRDGDLASLWRRRGVSKGRRDAREAKAADARRVAVVGGGG